MRFIGVKVTCFHNGKNMAPGLIRHNSEVIKYIHMNFLHSMMIWWHVNTIFVIGLLWGESGRYRLIPLTYRQ